MRAFIGVIKAFAAASAITSLCMGAPADCAPKQSAQPAPPMVVLMGSVTNAMWPIGNVGAMEKTASFSRTMGVTAFESYTPWSVLEPKAQGRFDWTETDKLDSICRKTGLKWQAAVMANPSYATPKWFKESGKDVPFRCLEHNQDSDVRSIWCPGLAEHVDRVLGALLSRYKNSPAMESVQLCVSGDFGETLYPAGALGWNGQFHNHMGYWCADEHAVKAFREWARAHYRSISRLNAAWGTRLSSFDDLRFQLPDKPMSDARWLDQSEWYRGEMVRWSEQWCRIARKYARPGLPIYMCVGGTDSVPIGFDVTGEAKVCAKHNVWLRLTNEGSIYPDNFLWTRQLTTAAKLYGVPYGLEPAGEVNEKGVAARIFGAAAAGCNHLHYYEGQVANFGACTPAGERTAIWNAERDHLVRKPPYVNVAAFYPRTDGLCKRQMGAESLSRYSGLRDYMDFDFVDDNLVRDGKLDRYRYLLMGPCRTMEAGARDALLKWVRSGGVLIATEQSAFRTWKPFGIPAITKARPLTGKAYQWAAASVEMPAEFAIHPGNLPSEAQLTGDWSHSEGNFRWGGKTAGFTTNVDPTQDYTIAIDGGVPVGGAVLVNGQEIGRIKGGSGTDHSWTLRIPSRALKGSNVMQVDFRMKPYVIATDSRDLCIYPHTITLRTPKGNTALNAPRLGKVRIDARKLAASTTVIGRGCVIALPPVELSTALYAHVVTALLRTRLPINSPACCVPDGASDRLFVACRGDEVLVYNGGTEPIDAKLVLPAGAELDRYHRTTGTTIRIRGMAPNRIEAYPLPVRVQTTGR